MAGSMVHGLRGGVVVLCVCGVMFASPAADAQLQPATGLRSAGSATGLKLRTAGDGAQQFAGETGMLRFGNWLLSYGGSPGVPFQAQDDASFPSSLYPPGYALSGSFSLQASGHWGNFHGSYTRYNGIGDTLQVRNGHRFQLNYHYTGRSTFGLAYSEGREFDDFAAAQVFPGADRRNWSLGGQHWLSPSWALTYRFINQEPSGFYRRQGLRLGIRHDF